VECQTCANCEVANFNAARAQVKINNSLVCHITSVISYLYKSIDVINDYYLFVCKGLYLVAVERQKQNRQQAIAQVLKVMDSKATSGGEVA
jgi:hypothetical protein